MDIHVRRMAMNRRGFRVQADAGESATFRCDDSFPEFDPGRSASDHAQNAERLTPEEIRRLFPDKEIAEAAGVLEMISQTPEQLMLYNARLKFHRDEEARLAQARLEDEARGEARGRQEGLLAGRIVLLQQLLGVPEFTLDEFAGYDRAQLHDMADQLQHQLRSRGQ